METPILLIIFNRPDTTQKVFDQIKKVKPKNFFITADGPRNNKSGEKEKCEESRKIIEQIDWECNIHKNFHNTNLGCRLGVTSGINWFFKNVGEGIILEDDCFPDISFFYFCEEMLKKYKTNEKIMHISGNFFQPEPIGKDDYYFSKVPHIWGWATWRRSWGKYSLEMDGYKEFLKNKSLEKMFPKKQAILWKHLFDQVFNNKSKSSWDFQWTYSIFLNNGLAVTPNKNLVKSIGFGSFAENCKNPNDKFANLAINEIHFPLSHPELVSPDNNADIYTSMNNFNFTNLKYFLLKIGLFNFFQMINREIKK